MNKRTSCLENGAIRLNEANIIMTEYDSDIKDEGNGISQSSKVTGTYDDYRRNSYSP